MNKHKVFSILLYSAATLGVAAFALHVTSQHDNVEETDKSASAETNQTVEDMKSNSDTSLADKVIDRATSAYLDAANKLEDVIIKASDTTDSMTDKTDADNSVLQVKATEVSDSSSASGRDRAHETKTTQTSLSITDTNQASAQQVVKENPIEHQVASEDKKQSTEVPIVEEKGTPEVRPTLPEAKVPEKPLDAKGESEVRPALPEAKVPDKQVAPETPVVEDKGVPETRPALPEAKVPDKQAESETPVAPAAPIVEEKGMPEVQPALSEAVVEEKGIPEVRPSLPEAVVEEKGVPEVRPSLPEAVITEKGQPEVRPALSEAIVEEKGTPEVRPSLPEASVPETPIASETPVVTEKGIPETQPALPEAVITETGTPEIQPALPEAIVSETGTPEIQPDLPEAVITETGTPEVQPALPEAVITETGTPEVQPALPEASIPETPKVTEAPAITEKGQPEVVQIKPEYHFHTENREEVTTLKIRPRQIGSLKMNKGETKIIEKGKDGSITKVYEEVIGEHNEVLSSTLKNETRIEPVEEVSRYGTKLAANDPSETGLYRISEHTRDIDVVKFNQDTELNGREIKALGQDEINRRSSGDESNTLLTVDKSDLRHLTIYPAPLSDESIDKFNSGEYIDHKRVGKEVLKLVNQERHKLGLNELLWSDDLYELAKVRATEIGENGNIRFWTADGKRMAHVRDTTGKSWLTVSRGTKFGGHWLGENLADYTTSSNVYKAFSEKLIAEQLYTQWYGSEPHYKNMISKDYTQFAFDLNYSKFWRLNGTSVNYLSQGIHGVQLFAE